MEAAIERGDEPVRVAGNAALAQTDGDAAQALLHELARGDASEHVRVEALSDVAVDEDGFAVYREILSGDPSSHLRRQARGFLGFAARGDADAGTRSRVEELVLLAAENNASEEVREEARAVLAQL